MIYDYRMLVVIIINGIIRIYYDQNDYYMTT